MSNFRPINRDTGFLLPPSVDEWLPQRHLACKSLGDLNTRGNDFNSDAQDRLIDRR